VSGGSVRVTDEQLELWADPDEPCAMFPVYWSDEHDQFIASMAAELIHRRQQMAAVTDTATAAATAYSGRMSGKYVHADVAKGMRAVGTAVLAALRFPRG
jgi:hypothetical protein